MNLQFLPNILNPKQDPHIRKSPTVKTFEKQPNPDSAPSFEKGKIKMENTDLNPRNVQIVLDRFKAGVPPHEILRALHDAGNRDVTLEIIQKVCSKMPTLCLTQ